MSPAAKPSVSVIIPAYNSAATLPTTLESIAAQTHQPCEIIICDDGSRDDTWPYLQGLGTKFNGIPLRVFRQANLGAGAARNRGITEASGKYLAFLDADDIWLPAKLQRSVEELERTGSAFICHDFIPFDDTADQAPVLCSAVAKQPFIRASNPRQVLFFRNFVATSTVVARVEDLRRVGGGDTTNHYGEDWELWLALACQSVSSTFLCLPEALTRYRINPAGMTRQGPVRLLQREYFIPSVCATMAPVAGLRPLPTLLVCWALLQYECLGFCLSRRRYKQSVWLVARLPWSLLRQLGALYLPSRVTQRPRARPTYLTAE